MLRYRHGLPWLSCLLLAWPAATVRADAPPDPLRLVPAQADVVLKIEQPHKLVETIYSHDLVKQLQKLEAVRELYDSTNARRFYQLAAYFEKQLGAERFELLDRLAGGGMVLAVKIAPDPAPALLVVQSKDEKTLRQFVQLALEVAEQEAARQESKFALKKTSYRAIDGVQLDKKVYLTVAGSALLIASSEATLKAAIDLHLDGDARSVLHSDTLKEARALLPANPSAWAWVNLNPVHASPQAKEFDAATEKNTTLILLIGGVRDVVRRSPFVCAGIYPGPDGLTATVRLPRGRFGMAPTAKVLMPPDDKGTLPPLEPANALLSTSYYLDLARLWEQRDQLLSEQERQGLDKFEKRSGLFLGGVRLGKLLGQTGAHQRFVMAQQDHSTVYKTQPGQRIVAFAFVQEMRDPAFASTMGTLLRAAALLGSTQFDLKLVEEKRGEHTLVSYRFPENRKIADDANNVRYNYSPCFVSVGDQFVMSSTIELGRELVDLIAKEQGGQGVSPALLRTRLYSSGGAAFLRSTEDQLITQTVLAQAQDPRSAAEQVRTFIRLVERLGTLQIESVYGSNDYRLDIRLQLSK